MKFAADLHIHSHYSRATSKNLTPEGIARWAQIKGIQIVATGDISHPGWLQELKDRLEPAEEGLFRLKAEYASAVEAQVPPACRGPVRFVLGGEISNIYKRGERTRKVHNLAFAPGFEAAERLQAALDRIGNIRADGRPILGLDSRDLLEIVLEAGAGCCLIPAHIWTPWFSLLGSKSGFDSVEECFGDLTPHIFALETGLSSDPPMNWRVSALDPYTLVSNSDAHSAEKLGRELTLFDCEPSYPALFAALRAGATAGAFDGTVEFFPEEGKYHFDGHRACGIAWDPATTLAHDCKCPVCGKEVTVGVMHRVAALADRPEGGRPASTAPFTSLIPLPEVLGEVYGVGAGSRQVEAEYTKLLGRLGPEMGILRKAGVEDISRVGGPRLAEAIGRMRRGEVVAQPGYDGEYGVIRVFPGGVGRALPGQVGLFGEEDAGAVTSKPADPPQSADARPPAPAAAAAQKSLFDAPDLGEYGETPGTTEDPADVGQFGKLPPTSKQEAGQFGKLPYKTAQNSELLEGLNDEQQEAALCVDRPLVIVAGPGTGKTRTLTVRIAHLILNRGVAPESVLAITFTNKAAGEMAERLAGLVGPEVTARITIKTFHAFGAMLLREHAAALALDPDFVLCAAEERIMALRGARPDLHEAQAEAAIERIAAAKDRLLGPDAAELEAEEQAQPGFRGVYRAYEAALAASSALDFDDLILRPVQALESRPELLAAVRARYRWISVDEYQDVNLAQYRLLRLLAGGGANLCVIGDPDQAIYGFRGADRRYFLSFQADYPAAATMRLSRNYRSTQLILDAAVQVIRGGGQDLRQDEQDGQDGPGALEAAQTLAEFAEQVKLDVHDAPTDRAEAEYIVHQIEQMVGGTSYFSLDSGRVTGSEPGTARTFGDFAVLYRLGSQSRLLIEAFARSGIPFQAAGQAPLYGHKLVRETLAYLWLLRQPESRLHLDTILAEGKRGFAPELTRGVTERLNAGDPLVEALEAVAQQAHLRPVQRSWLHELSAFWRVFVEGAPSRSVADLVDQAAAFVKRESDDTVSSEADIWRRLGLRAVSYGDRLLDFLESTALLGETDVYDPRADRVALLTLHAAKGLEFPVVFVAGCEEGLLPYLRAGEEPDIDEERRLFYVGMTRARQKLVLTRARTRFLFGRRMENPVSRFVEDIEAALKEAREMGQRGKRAESKQLSLF